jgi:predicted phage tail protein
MPSLLIRSQSAPASSEEAAHLTDTAKAPEVADTSLTGTQDGHPNAFVRALNAVPRLLASKAHVIFLFVLGVYLVLLPLFGVSVSAKAELIGGNYTNVTSDIGACIAAGGTVHLVKRHRAHQRQITELHDKLDQLLAATSPRGGSSAP